MSRDLLESLLLGMAGLWACIAAAGAITLARRPRPDGPVRPVVVAAGIAIAIQAAHAAEELATGFHVRFPTLLGLTAWPAWLFVAFNGMWLVVWVASLTARRPTFFPLWFLGLAGAANGVAHPLLALWTAGYFPGLATSPLVGIAGLVLLRRLARASATSSTGSA